MRLDQGLGQTIPGHRKKEKETERKSKEGRKEGRERKRKRERWGQCCGAAG